MDKETGTKILQILRDGFSFKFVQELRKFLMLLERYDIPIEQVYKYADITHKHHIKMTSAVVAGFQSDPNFLSQKDFEKRKLDISPKCPECGYHPYELIHVGSKVTKNNMYGYTYMYYCDNCMHEEFFKDKPYIEEFKRLEEIYDAPHKLRLDKIKELKAKKEIDKNG